MSSTRSVVDPDIADEVAAFLRAHPSFLSDNPDLYRVLTPPSRVHGEALADHMAAMIRAERANNAQYAARTDGMLAANRAATGLAGRVHEAVLALMRTTDPVEFITIELPGLLGIDAAALCLEQDMLGVRPLPAGTVDRLMRGRDVLFRQVPTETRMLHGEAAGLARADALVRVQLADCDGLLSLAVRDRDLLRREGGIGSLSFLGRALTTALDRRR